MAKVANIHFEVDPWKITENGFDANYSRVGESVFSLGNESNGVRGCFDEGGSIDSLRGAYINGVYDLADIDRSYRYRNGDQGAAYLSLLIPSYYQWKTKQTAKATFMDVLEIGSIAVTVVLKVQDKSNWWWGFGG